MELRIPVPRHAEEIVEKLQEHGFEAYVVGGCVRDSILGRRPEDWDITTSARPRQVKELFGRTVDTGIRHGTVTVLRGGRGYEVTTYRIDGEYEDGRHPKSVEFTSSLAEDLKRRDFTINAMAYNRRDGLVDLFGGAEDLKAGRIRCVGRAEDRFHEDALRILRALRFAAQLGFEIDGETENAIGKFAPHLALVSRERIQAEMTKLLMSENPQKVRQVFACGAGSYVSETFGTLRQERIALDGSFPAGKAARWAACLRQTAPERAGKILRELKMDNDTIRETETLAEWWNRPAGDTPAKLRVTMSRVPERVYEELLELKKAVLRYYAEGEIPVYDRIPESGEDLERIGAMTAEIRARGDCISLKTLAVTGNDLIRAGMEPGKELGETLERLFALVLERPEKNTREELLRAVGELSRGGDNAG